MGDVRSVTICHAIYALLRLCNKCNPKVIVGFGQ